MTRVTWDGKVNQFPIWSPDGCYIVFQDQEGLSWTRGDGAGEGGETQQSQHHVVFLENFFDELRRRVANK
jgi:Tol biopolymer transport system component